MAKGDRVGFVRCPKCRAKVRAGVLVDHSASRRGYQLTTRGSAARYLRKHLEQAHPELGIRERSLLIDRALRRLTFALTP